VADRITGFKVNCVGGLDTNRDMLAQPETAPGSAIQLINYEPSTTGGYRRISGYTNSYGTVTGTGKVLGVAVVEGLNDSVFACRAPSAGTNYFYKWVNSSSTWSAITTPGTVTTTGVKKVRFIKYNFTAKKVLLVDGINPAAVYDGTTYTQITHSSAPNSPKYAAVFKNHMFLGGDPTDPYNLYFSAPLNETDFSPANGAGVINVGFDIVQLKQFRDDLFIFGKNSIKRITGTSITDFNLIEVTSNLGCVVPDSVVELSGNLVFLGPDGFRPIGATANTTVGDTQIETISKKIQFTTAALIQELVTGGIDVETLSSVVVRKKTQFRLFIPSEGIFGLLGGLRQTEQGINFEYSLLFGIPATCTDSGYVGTNEIVLHGDANGKVYLQETGNNFNGDTILSVYQTPYYYFEDPTIRKNFYSISTFLRSEGNTNIVFSISYDFDAVDQQDVWNPTNFSVITTGTAAYFNEAIYDNSLAIYDGNPSPVRKTNINGSGFSIAMKYVTNDTNASHTVQGFVLNYAMNDRR
jgi:hypothetical protein